MHLYICFYFNAFYVYGARLPRLDRTTKTQSRPLSRRVEGRGRDIEGGDQEEEETPETIEMNLLRYVLGSSSTPKLSLSTYDGNLSVEGLVDQIGELDQYFDYEEIDKDKKVKLVVTRLKGQEALWRHSVQDKRKKKNKSVTKIWDRMIAKMRGKFFRKDYQLSLNRQMKNLRQSSLTVKEYT